MVYVKFKGKRRFWYWFVLPILVLYAVLLGGDLKIVRVKRHDSGERGKKDVVLTEELALCIKRILVEKKTQCEFNNIPFNGMTPKEISKEVCSRLGNDWTVGKLKKFGLKLE